MKINQEFNEIIAENFEPRERESLRKWGNEIMYKLDNVTASREKSWTEENPFNDHNANDS